MLKNAIPFVFLLFTFSVNGQNVDLANYNGLESAGDVPYLLTASSKEKYQEQSEREISKEEKLLLKRQKDQFYLSSTFQVDALLRSGNVIFGDEVSLYLNKLKDDILDVNGKTNLKEDITIFTVKSSMANAFATDQGVIFVTTGLLSRLKNEGELAFILCHELVHYLEKHNISRYIKKSELAQKKRKNNSNDLISSLSKFSKDNELVADSEGYTLYEKLDFSDEAPVSALKKLGYLHESAYLNYFDLAVWEDEGFDIPDFSFLKDTLNIEPRFDENDEVSSHPNLNTRISKLGTTFGIAHDSLTVNTENVNSEDFNKVVEIAKFESLNQLMLEYAYPRALHDAYNLSLTYPNNTFIDRVLVHALYSMAKLKNAGKLYDLFNDDAEGAETIIERISDKMSDVQLITVALKTALDKGEDEFFDISEDLIHELVAKEKDIYVSFQKGGADSAQFHYDALHAHIYNEKVINAFTDALQNTKGKVEEKSIYDDPRTRIYRNKEVIIGERGDYRKEPIRNVIVLDPNAIRIKSRYKQDYIKSEELKEEYKEIIGELSAKAGVQCEIYSTSGLQSNQTAELNRIRLLEQYIIEKISFENLNKIPFTKLSEDLKSQMKTDIIVFMSFFEGRRRYFTKYDIYKIFSRYTIPDIASKLIYPERYNIYQSAVIDISSNELLFYEFSTLLGRSTLALRKGKVYNLFHSLKKKI